jgi:hypothetical protein
MNTSTHPVAPEEVMALLDGELSADRAQSVSAHIDQCAECGQLANRVRNTSQTLTQWQLQALPAAVQERIFSAVSNATSFSAQGPNSFVRFRVLFSRPLPWAVACLALFVSVSAQFFSRRPRSEMFMARPKYKSVLETTQPSTPPFPPVAGLTLDGSDRTKQPTDDDKASSAYAFSSGSTGPASSVDHASVNQNIGRGMASGTQFSPMIARTVSLSIVVKDFDASRASLDGILVRNNGYAAGLNVATPQGAARTLQASLRIPASRLVAALAELKGLGRVEMETQGGEEVTQQHADLLARLKNSRETEQRLQDVLRTRTGKVKDVLEVEQEIERVRGEIEQMEAEHQTLEHRVDFATIDLKLAEEYKAQLSSPAPSVATQLRNATVNGFRNAFESLLSLILFLAESCPAILLWLALLFFPARLLWRRYQRSLAMG